MPTLEKIIDQDFRNIAFQELSFSPNVNCISGGNGEGKTNLLDAVYYLSMTKSAFSPSDRFNFRYGCDAFSLAGTYAMPSGLSSVITMSVSSSGEKKVRRDDKPYARVSEHIGLLPVVMVSPSDSALVSESGEERRRFMNAVLSQMDREYLSDVQQFNRLLAQRNLLLKKGTPEEDYLEVLDLQMSGYAQRIHSARKAFAAQLTPAVSRFYGILSSGREDVCVAYRSDMDQAPLEELLRGCRERDFAMRFTTAGPQRDDLVFLMDGHPIRRAGSQGQQKSFLVSLKFAQYEIMKEKYGFAPILLLDDVFDKLDLGRISNLLSMVAGSDFGQIFITDSNKVRMAGILDTFTSDRAYFECTGGTFKEL
jgi:DNA replication and repair protein RecF